MDKKEVMQEILDNRVKVHDNLDVARDRLYALIYGELKDIQCALYKDIEIIKRGEPFWDSLTDGRIAYENEVYQINKSRVDEICELINKLEDCVKFITQ